ncbi:fimbrial protein [Enterobacter ludwigii]|uniref:fimbrial protein n=1 Tax=Enterobacter ludwigii TaxID=299767 RepID=UPI0030761C22
MEIQRNKTAARSSLLRELRYYGTQLIIALMVPLGLGAIILLLPLSHAVDNWEVEGVNGSLYVHGALIESACRLEMTSSRQDIALADTSTGRLQKVGERGEPVGFELRLTDCIRSPARSTDVRSGGMLWSANQPAVTVTFLATGDENNPQLVKAHGVSGLGLRLLDTEGEDVRLGSRGKPLILTPGQNTLRYTVVPERTSANLVAGYYLATVDFHLSYE